MDSRSYIFCNDGRKIRVGDCALFKPHQDTSPPFIGIIRQLILDKDNYLNLGVNWLYRPADVQLSKGSLLEAAPNEIFYSFHKDQTPAASLLHPCKVAFLRKGVELPSGISSFVCRRVYDTSNNRLWWLTDRDYINERQEEVDHLLDKSRLEMHAAVQSGGRSPKPLNGPSSTQTLKPGSDGAQNSTNAFSSQVKQRKRERGEQGSESVKRERPTKIDDVNSGQFRLEGTLKSEIAKITDKGGLVDFEGVQKFVHLMQPDRSEKRLDVAGRMMLADVIAATDKNECLTKFVQLRGLSVLDEWLQEVHKGKSGDGSTTREMDKSVEDFLFALLRALDRLPVDLHALQNCNVGKSVNNLRSHKNLEIQKKARGLVDTWKKRVEAEMNMNDSKPGSNQSVSWPNTHGGSRRTGLSESHIKNSVIQPSVSKVTTIKLGHGDSSSKLTSSSTVSVKSPSLSAPAVAVPRDSPCKIPVGCSASDVPLSTIKEEKSSGSSQSQNNSQSCSSDHAKHVGSLWKEDARSSTAGSLNPSKTSSSASRHRKSSNGTVGSSASGASKESALVKCGSVDRKSMSEKVPQAGLACERAADVPPMDNGNNHRLIVRLPNLGRSPARSANGSSLDDPSTVASRGSPRLNERHDHFDRKVKAKTDSFRSSIVASVDKESRQKSDAKEEGDESPASLLDDEHDRTLDEVGKAVETSKVTCSLSGNHKGNYPNDPKPGRSHEASFRSINVLIESCAKYSEAMPSMPAGDDRGMNLLASVAAGEMVKSEHVSPSGSPRRSLSAQEESQSMYDGKRLYTEESVVHGQPDDSADGKGSTVGLLQVKGEESHGSVLDASSSKILEDCRSSTFAEEKPTGENSEGRIHEASTTEKKESTSEGINNRKDVPCGNGDVAGAEVLKPLEEISSDTKADCADEKVVHNGIASTATDLACGVDATGVTNEKEGVGDSVLCAPSENNGKGNNAHEGSSDGPTEHKLNCKVEGATECSERSSASGNDMDASNVDEKIQDKQNDSQRKENDLVVSEHNNGVQNSLERKDDKTQARETVEGDQSEECVSTAGGSSRSDGGGKLDFDLNEGFPVDDGIQGEAFATVTPGYSAHGSLSFLPTMSNGLPLVPVAAAAKGPFVPPENMLKSTGEFGWRGSAATSAFRPAEPRKVLEMQLTPDTVPNKHVQAQARPPLDIDLNEPDDRFQDDLSLQCSAQPAPSASSVLNLHDYKGIGIGSSRSVGGLDLDLNRVDEDTDTSQIPTSSGRRFEALSVKQPSAAEVNVLRNFDLNNGPGFDETGLEQQPIQRHHHQHIKSSVPFLPTVGGIRMSNNAEFGSLSSWFPPGNSYPAVAIPSILPDRGEQQAYPVVSTTGSQRILGPPTAGISFGPDGYRGPVLSSSPAVAFPPGTQFPYPGFPFGTNFPLPTTSFSSGYLDSSSTGGLVFPAAVPSQLSNHYPRPYVLSLPDGSANGGGLESNRRWVRQGLDLNAGPVGPSDIEGGGLPSASRQLASSQTLAEEQMRMYQAAGAAALKRKEPEGGWDTDRFSYKQHSWQ
ncbi:non-specific serine/threonine protein kinase [Ranunculus cassubicifolius]